MVRSVGIEEPIGVGLGGGCGGVVLLGFARGSRLRELS